MSYSKSTIIKLQQNESYSNINNNGSYDVMLNKSLILEDGDVVQLKSVFLDTTASSSGKIQLDNDIPVSISVAKYLQNFNKDQVLKTYTPARAGDAKVDNKLYFVCDTKDNHATIKKLLSITIRPHDTKQERWGCLDKHKDTILNFTYTNNNGVVNPFHIVVPPSKCRGLNSSRKLVYVKQDEVIPNDIESESFGKVPPVFRGDTFQYIGGQDILKKNNISRTIDIQETTITAGGTALSQMRHLTFNFTIPSGQYLPSELATLITQKLVKIDYFGNAVGEDDGNGIFPVDNPVLATLQQLKRDMFDNEGQTQFNLCREDGASVLSFTGDLTGQNDRFIGANQVSMQFDNDLNKLMWSILHFPIYVGDANSASAGALFESQGVANKYSGIFFTDLSPPDFWFNTLGFNPNILMNSGDSGNVLNIDGTQTLVSALTSDAVDGINMTGALKSIDLPIRKTTDFASVQGSSGTNVATNFTTPIYSQRIFNDPTARSGYFLIEIGGLPNTQDFRGSNNSVSNMESSKIQGIISRYYTTESFTMDEGQGGIQYIHSGEKATVNNFSIRVLDHNGNLPDDLGERNTVFLEVIKARNLEVMRSDDLDYSNK
jgi:hypothetical protein